MPTSSATMGNCLTLQRQVVPPAVGEKVRLSPPPTAACSVASTASAASSLGDLDLPTFPSAISNEFVVGNNSPNPQSLDGAFTQWSDPQSNSFVVLNPRTGLVLVSVTRIPDNRFTVSTPDGRLIATIASRVSRKGPLKKTYLEMVQKGGHPSFASCATAGEIIHVKMAGVPICEVGLRDLEIRSIQRGVDLVVVFVLVAVHRALG